MRRYLASELGAAGDNKWWRVLPKDIADKVVDGDLERLDFPDLKKALASQWSRLRVLPRFSTKSRSVVHLEELERIRNDIAHSRNISLEDLVTVQATYYHFEKALPVTAPAAAAPETELLLVEVHRLVVGGLPIDSGLAAAVSADSRLAPIAEGVAAYARLSSRPGVTPQKRREARKDLIAALDPLLRGVR